MKHQARKVLPLLLIFTFFFQVSVPLADEAASGNDEIYLQMLEEAATMPENYDFSALRSIYPKTTFFNPYGTFPKTEVHKLFDAYKAGDQSAASRLADYLKNNFPLPEAHTRYMTNYKALGSTDREEFHAWAARGLIYALLGSGNGAKPETAYHVLNISEEYMVARKYFEGRPGQSLHPVGGRVYDVLTGKDKKTGESRELWFDITDIWVKNPANELEK